MAHQIIKNVSIVGITTCVPRNVEENTSLPLFNLYLISCRVSYLTPNEESH